MSEVEPEEKPEDLSTLNCPLKKLTNEQKKALVEQYKDKNDHPAYEIRANSKGAMTIYKRRRNAEEEIKEEHPNAKLSDLQMLHAQIINLERRYVGLYDKHKRLKRRVNKIDEDTILFEDGIERDVSGDVSQSVIKPDVESPVTKAEAKHGARSLRALFV